MLKRNTVYKLCELNQNLLLIVYFVLTIEYELYNFFKFGSLISGTVLTWIEILVLLIIIVTSLRKITNQCIIYILLLAGILWTYLCYPMCRSILYELFGEGSCIKKIFLLPLAFQCIDDPQKFSNKLYKLAILEGYIHVLSNLIWGYGYNQWGVFNYMTFGMALITPTCIVMQRAFEKPTKFNIISVIIFELNIVLYAHRGALLVTIIMLLIYFNKYINVNRKIVIILFGLLAIILLALFKIQIIQAAINIMNSYGIESRTLEKMLTGDITNDSERSLIWSYMAISIMKNFPFGTGIGSDRLLLAHSMREGLYAHNFVFEFCVDFGIVIGIGLTIWIFKMIINILTKIDNEGWYRLIVPLFIPSVLTLLTSSSIYQYWIFWSALSLYHCYFSKILRYNNLRISYKKRRLK